MSDNTTRPDRYTVLEFTKTNGVDLIRSVKMLGLSYLVTSGINGGDVLFVFIDDAGRDKYMKGEWIENE